MHARGAPRPPGRRRRRLNQYGRSLGAARAHWPRAGPAILGRLNQCRRPGDGISRRRRCGAGGAAEDGPRGGWRRSLAQMRGNVRDIRDAVSMTFARYVDGWRRGEPQRRPRTRRQRRHRKLDKCVVKWYFSLKSCHLERAAVRLERKPRIACCLHHDLQLAWRPVDWCGRRVGRCLAGRLATPAKSCRIMRGQAGEIEPHLPCTFTAGRPARQSQHAAAGPELGRRWDLVKARVGGGNLGLADSELDSYRGLGWAQTKASWVPAEPGSNTARVGAETQTEQRHAAFQSCKAAARETSAAAYFWIIPL